MKIVKSRPDLLVKILLPLALACLISFTYLHHQLVICFRINWITTLACILLFAAPFGSHKIGDVDSSQNILRRVWAIWGLQSIMLFSFVSFLQALSFVDATQLPSHIIDTKFVEGSAITGFFPWTSYTLISIFLCIQRNISNKPAEFSTITLFNSTTASSSMGIVINSGLRNNSLISIAMSAFSVFILSSKLLYGSSAIFSAHWGLAPIGLSLCSILCMMMIKRAKLFYFSSLKKNSLFFTTLSLSLSIAVIFGFINGILTLINPTAFQMPGLLKMMMRTSSNTTIELLSALWWLCWMPLTCLYMAKQYRGLSVRSSIVLTMSLPILIYSILRLKIIDINSLSSPLQSKYHLIASLLATTILLVLHTRSKNRITLVNHYLPADNSPKFRPFTMMQEKVSVYFFIVIILAMLGGSHALIYLLVIVSLPSLFYPLAVMTQARSLWLRIKQ